MTPWEPFWDRIQRGFFLLGIGFFALIAAFETIGEQRRSAWIDGVLIVASVVYFFSVDRWMWRFPCPRCGASFFDPPGRSVHSFFVQECWACGLRKWGDPRTAPPPRTGARRSSGAGAAER
jgi:hypothetical protein